MTLSGVCKIIRGLGVGGFYINVFIKRYTRCVTFTDAGALKRCATWSVARKVGKKN